MGRLRGTVATAEPTVFKTMQRMKDAVVRPPHERLNGSAERAFGFWSLVDAMLPAVGLLCDSAGIRAGR